MFSYASIVVLRLFHYFQGDFILVLWWFLGDFI